MAEAGTGALTGGEGLAPDGQPGFDGDGLDGPLVMRHPLVLPGDTTGVCAAGALHTQPLALPPSPHRPHIALAPSHHLTSRFCVAQPAVHRRPTSSATASASTTLRNWTRPRASRKG